MPELNTRTHVRAAARAIRPIAVFAAVALWMASSVIAYAQDGEPTSRSWQIELAGMRETIVNLSELRDAAEHPSHGVKVELEHRGEVHTYLGIPFKFVVAMADGADTDHPWRFDSELWERGYDITLVASDGYAVTFNTTEISPDALYLAHREDGNDVTPRIVGDVSTRWWVKDLVRVELAMAPPEIAAPELSLSLLINGVRTEFSRSMLKGSAHYTEGIGQFTTSAGTVYRNRYAGIAVGAFLSDYVRLDPDTPVTVVASDGYEMTYAAEEITDTTGGVWILAFEIDGDPLPDDPGPIRTVKIGPDGVDIPGHLSVKMVEEIRVDATPYRDISLEITGRAHHTIDRQTLQSGINCHRTEVIYYNRKSGEETSYTGIPVWRLLAYADDPAYAPHGQDDSIRSYIDAEAASGYRVVITASDGYSIDLDSRELDKNDDVIIAMYREGAELPERERPLIIVWDRETETVPSGIKAVRGVVSIELVFEEE